MRPISEKKEIYTDRDAVPDLPDSQARAGIVIEMELLLGTNGSVEPYEG